MKKIFLIIIGSICIFYGLFAQKIEGKVVDEKNSPIEYANVVLYSLPDSVMVSGTITDSLGLFSIKTISDSLNYFLDISFLGYQTVKIPVKMGNYLIKLKDDSKLLKEVIIKGNLPSFSLKNDALITTVQNSILSKAGTGNDVLKRLPSLTGDNGVFSVFGKGQAKIYINNREMRDVSELDNLNSSDIKNVEIITNPGAQYDATIKAIIRINIIRQEGDGLGLDIRSSYSQSQNQNLTEQINVNYRRKNLDFFGTFKFNKDGWSKNSEMWQNTYVDTLWTQQNTMQSSGTEDLITGIAGVNYEVSSKHFFGAKYTLTALTSSKKYGTLNSLVFADGVFYDKWSSNDTLKKYTNPSNHINAYYNGIYGKVKVDFNIDFFTLKNNSVTDGIETSQNYDIRTINSKSDINSRLFASKLMLSFPLLAGQVSMGAEFTNTSRKDNYSSQQLKVSSSCTIINEENIAFFAEFVQTLSFGRLNHYGLKIHRLGFD